MLKSVNFRIGCEIHRNKALFLFSSYFKAFMAASLKLFQHLETILQSIAVSKQSENKISERTIFWKRTCFFLSMILYMIASLAYFVFEATSIVEYGDSFYLFSTECIITFILFTYVQKNSKISTFIDKLNTFLQKSKLALFLTSLRFIVSKI